MIGEKIILTLVAVSTLYSADALKCDKCSVAKEYMKCSYYVEQKADLSHQNSCMIYAKNMEEAGNNGRASWYYIIAGDFKAAIKSGEKALKIGEVYASEHIAEAYLLEGDQKRAKEYFVKLTKNRYDKLMTEKHFDILHKIYPEKFKIKSIENLSTK